MSFSKKTIRDIDVSGKTVVVRTSLNVPIESGKVTDRLRIEAAIPTLHYLLERNTKLVLLSHHSTEAVSLAPVAPILSELLDRPVTFLTDCIGMETKSAVQAMESGQVILLENVRFHPEEEANDPTFAQKLASLGELYVDDDFTTTHREHASMVGIPKLLPAVAGLQIEHEVEMLTEAMENPTRPFIAVVGGAKISTKIAFLDTFLARADALFVGGGMANTFLKARGSNIGKSLVEDDQLNEARRILEHADQKGVRLFLPLDVVVTDNVDQATNVRTVAAEDVQDSDIIADIGPASVEQLSKLLAQKGTVIWNGTLGIAEKPVFATSSLALAQAIINSGSTSILGGGDTAAFADEAGLHDKFSFVSTGGGASLELMSGKSLPAIEVLLDK